LTREGVVDEEFHRTIQKIKSDIVVAKRMEISNERYSNFVDIKKEVSKQLTSKMSLLPPTEVEEAILFILGFFVRVVCELQEIFI